MNTDPKTQQAKALAMAYYNQYLLDKKIITQQEYYRMANLIRAKYPLQKK